MLLLALLLTIEFPFRFASPEIPLVLIEVGVNEGRPMIAVLDTGQGVSPLLLSDVQAKQLGIAYREEDRVANTFGIGPNSGPRIYKARIQSMRLGGQTLPAMDIGVTDALRPIAEAIEQPLSANLGYLFLKDYTLVLNYRSKVVLLSSNALTKGTSFTLGSRKPLAIIEGRINGQGPYRFAVDTGASNSVLSQTLAQRLMLPHGIPVPVMGASGSSAGYMTKVQNFDIAGRRFADFTFATGDFFDAMSAAAGATVDGVLGANAFQDAVLTIDYPNRRLSITQP
ncbi:aspartyl protease family protein [Bryobacter aggregatus]|uniref:aspartyl protease family protein n=1 Tax=Bryobacter aggregatus TaxID=360054 RepID=UPI0004E162C0|nr:aspartyl protease family protein [Bryobacter aggregatus]